MDNMNQAPQTLAQASQQPNVQGALQQLLLSRVHTPEQMQQLEGKREAALGDYQKALTASPTGSFDPMQESMYAWASKIGSTSPQAALAYGIGAGGKLLREIEQAKQAGQINSARVGYEDAANQSKLNMGELSAIKSMAGGSGRGGVPFRYAKNADGTTTVFDNATGTPVGTYGPEDIGKISSMTQTLAKAAFERGEYGSLDEALSWAANEAVKVVGGMRGALGNRTTPLEGNVGGVPTTAPSLQKVNVDNSLSQTLSEEDRSAVGRLMARINQGAPSAVNDTKTLESILMKYQAPSAKPVDTSAMQKLDPAEEARKKTFQTETESAAVKNYSDVVAPAAAAAETVKNNIDVLRAVPLNMGAFAPYRAKVGEALEAMGMSGQLVSEAQNVQQIRPILTSIANNRLLLAKGVQTEGDAQRAFNEFVKITDTQKAADFMYAWSEELATRAQAKKEAYDKGAQLEGTHRKGEDYWKHTDYFKAAPVAMLPGARAGEPAKVWNYSSWRNKFLQANPSATPDDAAAAWNKLARGK